MISSVDCLDLISQTQPGKERVKKVRIELSQYAMMLFLEGSLLRILRKLSGLQSLELELGEGWDTMIPTKGSTKSSQIYDWPERFGRDFLLLVKNELSHIRKITLRPNSWAGDATHIPAWVSYELKKRNRAWVPPPPAYMTFHRTPSSMSVLHSQIIKRIADKEDFFKTKKDVKGVSHLEDAYAVFP